MARHHSDSSQVKDLLQPDNHSERCREEKHEHQGEHCRKDSSSQAASSSSSSSSVPSSTGAASRKQTERDRPFQTQREESTSPCLLEDLRQLPRCSNKLGPLYFSRTHTVLIDVRVCPFRLLCSSHRKSLSTATLVLYKFEPLVRHLTPFYATQDFCSTTCSCGRSTLSLHFSKVLHSKSYLSRGTEVLSKKVYLRYQQYTVVNGSCD